MAVAPLRRWAGSASLSIARSTVRAPEHPISAMLHPATSIQGADASVISTIPESPTNAPSAAVPHRVPTRAERASESLPSRSAPPMPHTEPAVPVSATIAASEPGRPISAARCAIPIIAGGTSTANASRLARFTRSTRARERLPTSSLTGILLPMRSSPISRRGRGSQPRGPAGSRRPDCAHRACGTPASTGAAACGG